MNNELTIARDKPIGPTGSCCENNTSNNLADNVIGTSGAHSSSNITCWSGRTGVNDEPLYKQHYATYELVGPTGPAQVILISNPYHC